jgi:flagellar biosynthesis repressor protein FlbT
MALTLVLRPGERMIVNGAVMRFARPTTVQLETRARFVFGKQVMTAADADTPARRLYLHLQTWYAGDHHERSGAREKAIALADAMRPALSATTGRVLGNALEMAEAGDHPASLELARELVRLEDNGEG